MIQIANSRVMIGAMARVIAELTMTRTGAVLRCTERSKAIVLAPLNAVDCVPAPLIPDDLERFFPFEAILWCLPLQAQLMLMFKQLPGEARHRVPVVPAWTRREPTCK